MPRIAVLAVLIGIAALGAAAALGLSLMEPERMPQSKRTRLFAGSCAVVLIAALAMLMAL